MSDRGFVVAWFYGLPSVSTDEEISDLATRSIRPLLKVHEMLHQPVIIVIAGSLLSRLEGVDPGLIGQMQKLVSAGIVEIGATFFHEIYPPVVPIRYIKRHLVRDLDVKEAWFGYRPTLFYPPNFAWLSVLPYLLLESAIRWVILDSGHFELSSSVQTWKWDIQLKGRMQSFLSSTLIDPRELYRVYRYPVGRESNDSDLRVAFRSFEIVRNLSFGTSGLFHRPLEDAELVEFFRKRFSTLSRGEFVTLADDGDRINATSLSNYERFIQLASEVGIVTPTDIESSDMEFQLIEYLPSYVLGDHRAFWMQDLDSVTYVRMLDDLCERNGAHEIENQILELQESYPLFWKTLARKEYYIRKLYDLIDR